MPTLTTIDEFRNSFKANGHRVRLYHKPLTKESFCQQVRDDPIMQILATGSDDPAALFS